MPRPVVVILPGDPQVEPGKRVDIAEDAAVTPAPFKLPAVDAKFKTVASTIDRKAGVPVTASFPDLKFPSLQRATLKNGTKVILAERHDIPVVQMSYEFRGGQAADPSTKPGTASFAMGLLDEGAGDLDALAFADRMESLGANLGAAAGLDSSSAYLSALKQNLEPSVALYADMLRKPRFDQGEIDRVKSQWIAGIGGGVVATLWNALAGRRLAHDGWPLAVGKALAVVGLGTVIDNLMFIAAVAVTLRIA